MAHILHEFRSRRFFVRSVWINGRERFEVVQIDGFGFRVAFTFETEREAAQCHRRLIEAREANRERRRL